MISLVTLQFESIGQISESVVRQKINVNLPTNSSKSITAAKIRETLNSVVDYSTKMTPVLSIAQLRQGKADTATAVQIIDDYKGGIFKYTSSVLSDDSAMVIVSGSRRYVRQLNEDRIVADFFKYSTDNGDDSKSIQRAIDYCDTNKKELQLLGRTYNIKSQVKLRNVTIIGVPRKTKLLIHSDFVFTETISGRNYTCILNEQYRGDFTTLNNKFYLKGIDFELGKNITDRDPSLLGIANTRGAVVENCNFIISDANTSNVTAIDIWASNKDLIVRGCSVSNLADVVRGGSIWVRNITTAGAVSTNDTENILVENCTVRHRTKDEPIAVYGVHGSTHDVTFKNCYVEGIASSQARSVLVSCFPLDDGTSNGDNAKVYNVTFDGMTLVDNYFTTHVVRFGQTGDDATHVSDNIVIKNSTFNISKTVTETSYVIRNIKCVGNSNKAINNYINVTSAHKISYGIAGFDVVSDNYLKGDIDRAVANSKSVRSNRIDGVTGIGIESCEQIFGNIVKSLSHCILINTATNRHEIEANNLENTDNVAGVSRVGVYIQSIAGLSPAAIIENNIIKMNYVGNYAIRKEASGSVRVTRNTIEGNGKTVLCTGTALAEVVGNIWYSLGRDQQRSAGYIDADHNNACPIGSYTFLTTGGADISIKKTNNGNSADWVDKTI